MADDLKLKTLELLKSYSDAQTEQLKQRYRNRIVSLNLGLAQKVAGRYAAKCSEPFDDLLQEGVLGLSRAVELFDLGNGAAFSSFAVPYIRGGIQHYLRDRGDTIRIPRIWSEKRSKIERLRAEGWATEAIATQLRFSSTDELIECETALRRLPFKSLDGEDSDRTSALEWQGSAIELVSIEGILVSSGFDVLPDGFFDATAICKQEGREFAKFWRLDCTKKRVTELKNIHQMDVFRISRGRNGKSFLHKSLAFEFLLWVNSTKYRPVLLAAMVGNLESMYK